MVKNYRRIFVKQMVGSELTSNYHLVYEGSLKINWYTIKRFIRLAVSVHSDVSFSNGSSFLGSRNISYTNVWWIVVEILSGQFPFGKRQWFESIIDYKAGQIKLWTTPKNSNQSNLLDWEPPSGGLRPKKTGLLRASHNASTVMYSISCVYMLQHI